MKFVQQNKITFESIQKIQQLRPRRICFTSTSHKDALRRETDYVGKFVLPFPDTIYPIFHSITKLDLFYSDVYDNYWRSVRTEKEYQQIEEFITWAGDLVFLRDTLALSVALSSHQNEDLSRTEIGELVYQAKYHDDGVAFPQLAELCVSACGKLPFYKDVKFFCAIPPSDNQEPNLPTYIVNYITKPHHLVDITGYAYWANPKRRLKELPLDEKWTTLEQADLRVNKDLTDTTVILLDDLYQSGLTMQYVAMKLQEAGAKAIFGLTLVKSRRDSDNQ